MKRRLILFLIIFIIYLPFLFLTLYYYSRATAIKANIVIDTKKTIGLFPESFKALAQGGEERGVRMLKNIVPQIAGIYPRYIRLDHIYDYYDVISRDPAGKLIFNFTKLDETVCDIYHTGAKPFFSLGYMSPAISSDGTLISIPNNWDDWATVVQKTIEHYSGINTRLCGQITGYWMSDIYYEVWNEPDLESFGKWSLYDGEKDYKKLYYYSSLGASRAADVNRFLLGGPSTTTLYKNWIKVFLDYISQNNLRLDFISWHHYSKNTSDYVDSMIKLNNWLSQPEYIKYQRLPKIISEWGYDSDPNPIADTNIGAAHTVASIRNFVETGLEMAFLFEIKDGPAPRWGIISYDGVVKPRYKALKLLNLLEGQKLAVKGEGTYVNSLASISEQKITVVLVNYDTENKNIELAPITLTNLESGNYSLTINYLEGDPINISKISVLDNELRRDILMKPNTVVVLEVKKND